jgi:hypothetical protein
VVQQWNLLKPAANEVIVDCRFPIANFRSGEVSFSIDNRQSTIDNGSVARFALKQRLSL